MSDRAVARLQLADEFWPKLEEWMERSKGRIRADVAHEKLVGAEVCPERKEGPM